MPNYLPRFLGLNIAAECLLFMEWERQRKFFLTASDHQKLVRMDDKPNLGIGRYKGKDVAHQSLSGEKYGGVLRFSSRQAGPIYSTAYLAYRPI